MLKKQFGKAASSTLFNSVVDVCEQLWIRDYSLITWKATGTRVFIVIFYKIAFKYSAEGKLFYLCLSIDLYL